MAAEEVSSSSSWTWDENQAFEIAIADYSEDCVDRWEKMTAAVPGKKVEDIKRHYELLVEDVNAIEAGRVPMPNYISTSDGSADQGGGGGKKVGHLHRESGNGSRASRAADQERRKGIAWTEDEHRLFLLGLDKYGKGDWRSISRNFVISRTPTQVASHAQKYFIRLNSMNKDRRRTSIHDITTVGSGEISPPQGPITGQVNGQLAVASGKPIKQPSQSPPGPPGVDVYGTTIGHPVNRPLIPAIGTPVNFPVLNTPHMAYGVRAPASGTMVHGAPVKLEPMSHPMHRKSSAQR